MNSVGRLRFDADLTTAQCLEGIGFRQERTGPHGGRRDGRIRGIDGFAGAPASDGDRDLDLDHRKPDRLRIKGDVDFQLTFRGDKHLEGARGVPHEADEEVLRPGGNIGEQVSPVTRGDRVAVEVGQDDDGSGERHAGLAITHNSHYRGGPGLDGRQDLDCCEKRKRHLQCPASFF